MIEQLGVSRGVDATGGVSAISSGFLFRVDGEVGILTTLHGIVGATRIVVKNETAESQVQLKRLMWYMTWHF